MCVSGGIYGILAGYSPYINKYIYIKFLRALTLKSCCSSPRMLGFPACTVTPSSFDQCFLVFLLLISTLGIGPRASNMLGKLSALEFHSSPSFDFSFWGSLTKFPRLDLNSLCSLDRPWTCHPPPPCLLSNKFISTLGPGSLSSVSSSHPEVCT